MNAATTPPDDDLQAQPLPDANHWTALNDPFEEDGETSTHEEVAPGTAGPATASTASEQQLAAWIDSIVDRDERALAALYDATFSRVFGLVVSVASRPS